MDKFKDNKEEKTKKEIAIFYGNCHATALRILLSKYEPFTDKYDIYPIKAIQEVSDPSYFNDPMFEKCDLFIHQAIRKDNRYGEEYSSENIIKLLKKDCKIIAIPNVYHLPMFYFPQYIEKEEFVLKEDTLFFRDTVLDEIYKNKRFNIHAAEIAYYDSQYFSNELIKSLYDEFIKKIKIREKDWDVKVVEFICNNISEHQLFFDPNHPTPFFISYIATELLKILNIEMKDEIISKIDQLILDKYEMPIHESVYRFFNMKFNRKNIRDKKRGFLNNLDIRKYIIRYWTFEWQNKDNDFLNILISKFIFCFISIARFVHKYISKIK